MYIVSAAAVYKRVSQFISTGEIFKTLYIFVLCAGRVNDLYNFLNTCSQSAYIYIYIENSIIKHIISGSSSIDDGQKFSYFSLAAILNTGWLWLLLYRIQDKIVHRVDVLFTLEFILWSLE